MKVYLRHRPHLPVELLSQLKDALMFSEAVKWIAVNAADVLLVAQYQILDPVPVPHLKNLLW